MASGPARLYRRAWIFILLVPPFLGVAGCHGIPAAPTPEIREATPAEILQQVRDESAAWRNFGPGSWVLFRSVFTQNGLEGAPTWFRMTRLALDRAETTELTSLRAVTSANGVKSFEPTGSGRTLTYPVVVHEGIRELPRETLEIEGNKIECRVFTATEVGSPKEPVAGQAETRAEVTVWYATEAAAVPRIVRFKGSGTWSSPDGAPTGTQTWIVVERNQSLEVGGQRVRTWRTRREWESAAKTDSYVSEIVCSDEVPGGYIHANYRGVFIFDGKEYISLSVSDAIEFHVEPVGK